MVKSKVMTILICEDDEMTLRATATKMRREGYNTLTAMDGKTSAAIIKENKFDMLITDLLLPYMTGIELIHLMKHELLIDKPIIVFSSIGLENTVLRAFNMGIDDYLVKPFSLKELAFRVMLTFKRKGLKISIK
jgi:DNA-binding response OmpR family regulator